MNIHTRQGDCEETTLVDGTRVWKDDVRVAVAGELDELCSWLGVVAAHLPPVCADQRGQLVRIQQDLFQLGMAVQSNGKSAPADTALAGDLLAASGACMERSLAPLKTFIVPGGSPAAAYAHVARTVCRRAERALVPMAREASGGAAETLRAVCARLNALGGWLFLLARYINLSQGVADGLAEG